MYASVDTEVERKLSNSATSVMLDAGIASSMLLRVRGETMIKPLPVSCSRCWTAGGWSLMDRRRH